MLMLYHQHISISIAISIMVLITSCSLLVPPPNNVQAFIVIGEGQKVQFTYWPQINNERELKREHYYLGGVQVRVASCPGVQCDHLVWDIENNAVWNRTQPTTDLVSLPESIKYGEAIPGMQITVPAESLKSNVTYSVVIGIMGLSEKYENKIYFSSQALFSLDKIKK